MSDLVVFYSLSGKSRYVAERLAATLKANLAEIVEVNPRDFAFRGFIRCALDSLLRRRPAIKPMAQRAGAYDRVFLACPTWTGRIAGPARTWLAGEGRGAPVLGLALQSGGGVAYGGVIREFESITGRRPEPLLTMSETDFGNKAEDAKIDAFARSIAVAPARFPKN
jgi:hypothetical protein